MIGVMFVHGFTGAPSSWEGVRSALSMDHVVWSPTLLGHDAREAAQAPRSLEREADLLAQRVTTTLPAPRVICGYSLGARVSLTLLARHPTLFEAAVLIGVSPGLPTQAEREARQAADALWIEQLEQQGLAAFVAGWEAQPLFAAAQQSLPLALVAQERARRLGHTAAGLARSLGSQGLGRMTPVDPRRVRARVTLVVGDRDEKFVAIARALAPRLERAKVTLAQGCGHNVPLERPQAVARALEETCP